MSIDTATDALIARWIAPNPHRPGNAEAWVLPRHVSIWAVIGQLELDHDNVDSVAAQYELPREAVEAAIAYCRRHREEIDARIAANRAFFAS